jgi:thymidylate synthase ThyX
MAYEAKVLADSVSPTGARLITVEAKYPRIIHSELMTHRVFSRNAASSRAIPTMRAIEQVEADPFMPTTFYKVVKGMGQGVPLEDQEGAKAIWMEACEIAVTAAKALAGMENAKSQVNRLLESFSWMTTIITSTEWENFFALRVPPGDEVDTDFPAQPEFQRVGLMMREVMRASNPQVIPDGAWHLPLVSHEEIRDVLRRSVLMDEGWRQLAMVSAGRCARVSFDRQGETEPVEDSLARAERLADSGHLSPFEHPATPCVDNDDGNFRDWRQYRGLIEHETNRVGFLEGRPGWEVVD